MVYHRLLFICLHVVGVGTEGGGDMAMEIVVR